MYVTTSSALPIFKADCEMLLFIVATKCEPFSGLSQRQRQSVKNLLKKLY
jgi:hypothetical protein